MYKGRCHSGMYIRFHRQITTFLKKIPLSVKILTKQIPCEKHAVLIVLGAGCWVLGAGSSIPYYLVPST